MSPPRTTRRPDTAPATLVEYADYECPCGRGAYYVIRGLQRELGDQLRFVYRNFPLRDIHPHTQHAAEAAEAAAEQGRFWEMNDHLFEHRHALDDEASRGGSCQVGYGSKDAPARRPAHSSLDPSP